jgi:hypothetical protein
MLKNMDIILDSDVLFQENCVFLRENKVRMINLLKMKNIITLTLIFTVIFVLTGCRKIDASKYTGTYIGTLIAIDYTKEDVELVFVNKDGNKEILYLYDVALTRISKGQYDADEEIALKIIKMLNEDITPDIISNTSTVFVFDTDEVTMDMHYNVAGTADTFHVRYIGNK